MDGVTGHATQVIMALPGFTVAIMGGLLQLWESALSAQVSFFLWHGAIGWIGLDGIGVSWDLGVGDLSKMRAPLPNAPVPPEPQYVGRASLCSHG